MDEYKPQTIGEKTLDLEAENDIKHRDKVRQVAPRLEAAILAVYVRLDTELDETKRQKLQELLSCLGIVQNYGYEYSEEQYREQLRILEAI